MARSRRKGPFVASCVADKVRQMNLSGEKSIILPNWVKKLFFEPLRKSLDS